MTRSRYARPGALILAVGLCLASGLTGDGPAAQEDRSEDRAALRTLRDAGARALNARDFAAAAALLHPEFTIVTVDQQRFNGLPAFQAYWQGLFQGPQASLRSVTLAPETETTRFLGEDVAVSQGTSSDTYVFADGDTRVMKARWSAVSQKVDGQWKLRHVHIGTSLFDNPVLHAATRVAWRTAIGAGLIALIVGLGAGFLLGRRSGARRA